MKKLLLVTAVIALLCLGSIAQAITIDMVTVGDAGNLADTRYNLEPKYDHTAGYGAVAYDYKIGTYEVTAGQYTEFLNAVAKTDRYALYNMEMWNSTASQGIQRTGSDGSWTYSVTDAFTNRPISKVSWGDAARFTNWLHNGQTTGAQDGSTTEDGAYFLNGATTDAQLLLVLTHEADARYWIPTEDEWYKAAYYDPNKAGGAGYWYYPTSSNMTPGTDITDASSNNANYMGGSGTTEVGEFQNSKSAYGTFDQGGNVWEWDQDIFDEVTYDEAGDNIILRVPNNRGLRGGSYQDSLIGIDVGTEWEKWVNPLSAEWRNANVPTFERYNVGFRVASVVPEPMSIMLGIMGLGSVAGFKRLRRK